MLLVIIQDQVEQFRTGNRAKVELMLRYLMKTFLSELLNHKYSHHAFNNGSLHINIPNEFFCNI